MILAPRYHFRFGKERKGKNRGRLFDFEFFSNEIEIDPFSRRKFAKKRNEDEKKVGKKRKKKEDN